MHCYYKNNTVVNDYCTERFELIHNDTYTYYKLYINNKCQFDEFCNEVKRRVLDNESLQAIYGYMEMLGAFPLPTSKHRIIKDAEQHDIWEFKKNNIRVYVIKTAKEVYIVMGGYKNDQKGDIDRVKRRVKDFTR